MPSSSPQEDSEVKGKYRRILDEIQEGFFETDLRGTITDYNASTCRMLGYSDRSLTGMNYREVTPEDTAQEMFKTFNRVFRTGEPVRIVDYKVRPKDRPETVIELSAYLIRDEEMNPIGFRGIIRDITAKVQAEEEKEQIKLQLEQVHRLEAVGTLAGGIAHDFNNILTSIQGYISILKLLTGSSHPNYEKLMRIDDLIQNGADLTKQLLGFALGGKYEILSLNLNTVLGNSLGMIPGLRKDFTVVEEYQDSLWTVEADRRQIEQMLLNLFRNAVYAMPNGGTLGIRSENCELDPHEAGKLDLPPGKYIQLSISDTGVGMTRTTMERIFEPFFTTKKMGRGTGLGLAASYGIVRNHNGKINVSSRMGEGSTFTIYLPALPEEACVSPPAGVPRKEATPGGSETILLVDNDQTILDIGKEILQELGYTVIAAGSGAVALELYEKNRDTIALVILDMIMPGQSGIETYHSLKEENPFLPVMLASGYSLDTQPMLNFLDKWDGFIQKPFHVKILARKIRTLLEAAAAR